MNGRILLACLLFAAFAAVETAAAQSASDDICFLVADNNGFRDEWDVLTTVDRSTGVETEIGVTGTTNIESLAFHPFSHSLYAADGGLLGHIHAGTGTFQPIGWLGTAYGEDGPVSTFDVDGLTFDPDSGTLYASVRRERSPDLLVRLNPANGQVVQDAFGAGRSYVKVNYGGANVDVDDLAVSPVSGNLFAVVTDSLSASTLVILSKTDGVATRFVDLQMEDIEGLTFDATGRLFASPGGNELSMVEINLATGGTTKVATLGVSGNRDYEGLTCMPQGSVSSVDVEPVDLPSRIALHPAYPNPFNPRTTISFDLPAATDVRLSVFDMLGREVELMAAGFWPAGTHDLRFEASDLPSGLYIYRLETREFVATRTVTLLR